MNIIIKSDRHTDEQTYERQMFIERKGLRISALCVRVDHVDPGVEVRLGGRLTVLMPHSTGPTDLK